MPRKSNRAAQGGGTIRQRKDGRWEGRYTIGRDPGTGNQVQKSIYGKTQAEVRKKLQAATTSIDAGMYTEPAKLKMGQWCDIWLKEYTAHIKPSTKLMYEAHVKNHIKPKLGMVRLQTLTAHAVQSFVNGLQATDDNSKVLAPKTVKNVHGVLHKALEQARQVGYITHNPAGGTKLPRWNRPEIKPLEYDMVLSFLNAIKAHPFERIYFTYLFTGLRRSEILGLTWDCIDFDNGTIYLYRQLQRLRKAYSFAPLKNDKPRLITPAPDVMKVLREQRIQQMQWRLKAGICWQPWEGAELIFTDELGNHLCDQTIYNHFKRIMAFLGLPQTRLHDLRHTYAVMSLQAGDDVKTVQEHLGHYTAAFTLDQYGHVTERMRKESAQRMQSLIDDIRAKK